MCLQKPAYCILAEDIVVVQFNVNREKTHALSRKVEILSLEFAEHVQELLEEPCELLGQLIVVRDVGRSLAKSSLRRNEEDIIKIREGYVLRRVAQPKVRATDSSRTIGFWE